MMNAHELPYSAARQLLAFVLSFIAQHKTSRQLDMDECSKGSIAYRFIEHQHF